MREVSREELESAQVWAWPNADSLRTTGARAELARTLRLRLYLQWRALADSASTIAIAARLGR